MPENTVPDRAKNNVFDEISSTEVTESTEVQLDVQLDETLSIDQKVEE